MCRHYSSCVHSTQQDSVFSINMSQKIDCFDTAYCSCYLLSLFSLYRANYRPVVVLWKTRNSTERTVRTACEQLLWVSDLTILEVKHFLPLPIYESASGEREGVSGTRQQAQGWTGVTPSLTFVWGVNWIIHEHKQSPGKSGSYKLSQTAEF